MSIRVLLLPFLMLSCTLFAAGNADPKKSRPTVEIKKIKGNYNLFRNGEPYYIRGAGGYEYFEKIKEYGGNSVRLWTSYGAKKFLDQAQELGLTVTLGLEMKLERHGFNYDDEKAVAEQLEILKKEVLIYKDHPALLFWGVGNEVEQYANNYAVWDAVNELAKFIHEVDPNHPTTTMLAGVPKAHIGELIKRAPEIDILSINAFKDLPYIKKKITDAGWTGPYMIGEWGASGYWETPVTPWGVFIEETSTEKANVCAQRYTQAIIANTDRCLGSYIFYWGYKQARTHTLLSLFLETGEEIGVLDVMQKEWTGKEPFNRAPLLDYIWIGDDNTVQNEIYLAPGSYHYAFSKVSDPDNDTLWYNWEIYYESREKKEGGDKEDKPWKVDGLITDWSKDQLYFKAPEWPGPYRLFVYVYDGHKNVATANIPFYVK